MSNTIHVKIDYADGSLLRLIGLIERRGFHIDHMSLSDAGGEREVSIKVRARDGGRCVEVLGRQIDRLFGVARAMPAPRAETPAFEEEAEVCVA